MLNHIIEVANQLKKGTAIEIPNPLYGSMGERFKPAHCSRAEPKGSEGSNPSASAKCKLEDCRNGNGPDLKSEVTEMLWEFESLIFRKRYITAIVRVV